MKNSIEYLMFSSKVLEMTYNLVNSTVAWYLYVSVDSVLPKLLTFLGWEFNFQISKASQKKKMRNKIGRKFRLNA